MLSTILLHQVCLSIHMSVHHTVTLLLIFYNSGVTSYIKNSLN